MSNAMALVRGLGHLVKSGGGEPAPAPPPCKYLLLDLPPPRTADIEFADITLTAPARWRKSERKTILKGISGKFRSAELTAIIGPSGAGKSSLLNVLTGFAKDDVTGTVTIAGAKSTIGGRHKSLKTYRKQSCYILQDDRLNPLFTVAEILHIAADLKLGNCLTPKAKQIVINDALDTLGLTGTEYTRCSNLSGGQRKRLSIALELIDNPPVMFLDEPTTGLDSASSAQCIQLLKSLSRGGRTIICTVHQPTATVYELFDQVYVMAEGLCIYQGSSENTVPYLASVGLHCPKYHNPADYLLEVANGEYGRFNEQLSIANKAQDWHKPRPHNTGPPGHTEDKFMCGKATVMVAPPSEFYKFFVLVNRCSIQLYRDWTVTHLKVLLHIIIGVLLGLMFQTAGNDGSKTISNFGYLMITIVYLCYTSLMPAVVKFPHELPILKKEHFNNWYNLKTYYAAVLITNIPVQIFFSLVYCSSSYFMSGQPPELYRFLMFVIICSLLTLIADALGNVIGTCVNAVNGTFLGAIFTCAMLLFAGYLVFFSHMSVAMRYVSYTSYMRYGMEGLILAVYGYERPPLPCPDAELYCHYRYPAAFLTEMSMVQDHYWFDVMVLFGKLVLFRIIAYFTLNRNIKLAS